MTELSEEEKNKIRAEMEYRELVRRELAPLPGLQGKISGFLAHPAFVTVLGGILIAIVGAALQYNYQRQQAKEAHAQQIADKKLAMSSELSVSFHRDITILVNRSLLRNSLRTAKNDPDYRDEKGRDRKEIMRLYDKLVEDYLKRGRPSAEMAELQAWFCTEELVALAKEMNKEIHDFERAEGVDKLTKEDIGKFADKMETGIEKMIPLMVREARAGRICPSMAR